MARTQSTRKKTYTVDFFSDHLDGENVGFSKDKLFSYGEVCWEGFYLPSNYYYRGLYHVGGRRYLTTSDGSVWTFNGWEFEILLEKAFKIEPMIREIVYEGEKRVLIAGVEKAYIVGVGEITLPMPFYSVHEECAGILFTANGSELYFTKPFAPTYNSQPMEVENFITLDKRLGNVVGLFAFDKTLFICCRKGFCNLKIEGENKYKLEILSLPISGVSIGHPVKIKDSVYFISEDKLVKYTDKKVEQIDLSPEDSKEIYLSSTLAVVDGKVAFTCCFGDATQEKMVLFDPDTQEKLLYCPCSLISKEGNLLVRKDTNETGFFSAVRFQSMINGEWKSKPLDFGTPKRKRLLLLNAKTSGNVEVEISGDFGSKTLYLNGRTSVADNLVSKHFTVKIKGFVDSLTTQDLTFEYQTIGG